MQIPLRYMSIGTTHAVAVFDNMSNTVKGQSKKEHSGREVLIWGGNESFQLGTGKRNNVASPVHLHEVTTEKGITSPSFGDANSRLLLKTMHSRKQGLVEANIVCGYLSTGVYWKSAN